MGVGEGGHLDDWDNFEGKRGLAAWTKVWGGLIGRKEPRLGSLEGEGRLGTLLGCPRTGNLFSQDIVEVGEVFLIGGTITFLSA